MGVGIEVWGFGVYGFVSEVYGKATRSRVFMTVEKKFEDTGLRV